MTKPFAWSYSALDGYETCGKKFYHQSVAKDFKDTTESDVGNYGQDVHKAIHHYVASKKALPMGMRQYQPFVDAFLRRPGDTYAEQKIAMNRSYRPTGYFDGDVWVRSQTDAAKHLGTHLEIVDWKFGKITDKWETQGLIMACVAMAQLQEVQTCTTMFVWWKEATNGIPPISTKTYTREKLWQEWLQLLPRVERLERAVQLTDFPAVPNGLCARYCPVTSCPHNGRR